MLHLDALKPAPSILYSVEWNIKASFPVIKRKAKLEESVESIQSHLKEPRS